MILTGMILTGCATFRAFPPETKAEEITWHSLHAVDIADTLAITRDPDCYYETVVGPLIGKHPSEGAVVIWGVAWSGVHFLVTDWLNDHAPSLVRYWQGLTIASTGFWIVHNRNNGVRPFSHNEPPPGVCGEPQELTSPPQHPPNWSPPRITFSVGW